jgi:methionine-gamma-lyase
MVKPFPSKTHIGNHLLHPETLMLNYGYDPQLSEGAVKPPVFLTSTFVFKTAEDGQDFFDFVSGRREPPEGGRRLGLFAVQPSQQRNRRG